MGRQAFSGRRPSPKYAQRPSRSSPKTKYARGRSRLARVARGPSQPHRDAGGRPQNEAAAGEGPREGDQNEAAAGEDRQGRDPGREEGDHKATQDPQALRDLRNRGRERPAPG